MREAGRRRHPREGHPVGIRKSQPDEGLYGGVLSRVSKARRISPTRGTGASTAAGKSPPLDFLQAAADIVAALPDAVVVTGANRRVLAANEAGAELLGWHVGEVVGQAIADNLSPSERSHVASR